MAKKYLLYIHSKYFEGEQEKSKLVNRLLNEWYASGTPEKPVVIVGPDVSKMLEESMQETEEEFDDYQAEIEARLVPVPGHPNAATDPVDEVTYKVKRVGGRLRIID